MGRQQPQDFELAFAEGIDQFLLCVAGGFRCAERCQQLVDEPSRSALLGDCRQRFGDDGARLHKDADEPLRLGQSDRAPQVVNRLAAIAPGAMREGLHDEDLDDAARPAACFGRWQEAPHEALRVLERGP